MNTLELQKTANEVRKGMGQKRDILADLCQQLIFTHICTLKS